MDCHHSHSLSQVLKPLCIPNAINAGNWRNSIFCQAINCTGYRPLFNRSNWAGQGRPVPKRESSCQQPEPREAALVRHREGSRWTSARSPRRWHLLDVFCSSCSCPGEHPQWPSEERTGPSQHEGSGYTKRSAFATAASSSGCLTSRTTAGFAL